MPVVESTSLAVGALTAQRRVALIERGVGWGLAGVGIAVATVGSVLLVSSFSPDLRFEVGAANRINGLATMGVGVGLTIPGIVLAVVGQRRLTDLDWRLRELLTAPAIAPLPGGVLAGVRLPL